MVITQITTFFLVSLSLPKSEEEEEEEEERRREEEKKKREEEEEEEEEEEISIPVAGLLMNDNKTNTWQICFATLE